MTEKPDIDIQAQGILAGLQSMGRLLDEPMTREALDLAKNATTAAHYSVLQRLQRSLTQYLERDGDLYYVGLLGHFSSGKSSTINSILGSWNTEAERETGLNPTDSTITLVTRDANVRSLLGVIREGHVTIRYQSVNSPVLDNVVLADTPGTGDPHLIAEIARDFLPICDVILFFFSAASPLDQTDMPLLVELHKRLPFIPIRFIVTRADELRLDTSKPVSEQNIDNSKRLHFFTAVLSRINKLLQPVVYTEEDFILIDNKARYNIDALINLIKAKCDPAHPHTRIVMHGHKLHYFLTASKELKMFFGGFLDGKLNELNKIVRTAEQNIHRYNENVLISNSNLTKNWLDQLTAIREARETTLNGLMLPNQLPTDIFRFESTAKRQNEIYNLTYNDAQYTAKQVSARVRLEISNRLKEQISALDIWTLNSPAENLPSTSIISIKIEPTSLLPLIPLSLVHHWGSLREAKASALREAAGSLRRSLEETTKLLQERAPLAKCEDIVHHAQKSLSDDLTQFFQNVELYRNGVFSHATKESISTLGIGAQLDALEAEFTDSDMTTFTTTTMQKLFQDFAEISTRALTGLTALDKDSRPLDISVREIKIPSPEVSQQTLAPALESEKLSLVRAIFSELADNIDHLLSNIQVRIDAALVETRRRYESDLALARRRRLGRYLAMIFGGCVFGLVAYFAYVQFDRAVTPDIFNAIIWNLVADVIFGGTGYLIARAFDNFPKNSTKIKTDYEAVLRRDINQILEEELRGHNFTAIDQPNLLERLSKSYRQVVESDPDEWQKAAADRLNMLREIDINFRRVRAAYADVIEKLVDGVSFYFSDATRNLQLLNGVANSIKARAIEPSFNLLEQTRHSLHNVKQEMQNIEF